ncbi:heme-dependent oxidative N-demethylase subunit alpha family protein [Nannocystaceae bacterium ST9]
MAPPARYFPVNAKPLRMQAGLLRFPVDLGNGLADRQFFQLDDEAPRYQADKAARLAPGGSPSGPRHLLRERDEAEARAHAAVLAWIDRTLDHEHPDYPRPRDPSSAYDARLRLLQEDAVVLHRDREGRDAAIMLHVYFPSGWRPERLLGASFADIHGPVPDFVDDPRAAGSMVDAMIERGPYLRFVWAIYPDDVLDHHPDDGGKLPWSAGRAGFLRIERQITVPFPDVGASLFLIRTYLRPFASLAPIERGTLVRAIEVMSEPIRRYKGVLGHEATILARLRDAGPIALPDEGVS